MATKTYLTKLSREELKKMILYPAKLWDELYEMIAEFNGIFAADFLSDVLGSDYHDWTNFDSTSYDWWLSIKPGRYEKVLEITDYSYFSDEDAKSIKELQAKVKDVYNKIDNLEESDDYYDKFGELEDEASPIADEIIQLVVKEAKAIEEVTDEQVLDMFIENDMGANYYYLDDDKSVIYRDCTEEYATNYKKGE